MDAIYWDAKKQTGVEIFYISGVRHVHLVVNYSAWIEDDEGDGTTDMERWVDEREIDTEIEKILRRFEEDGEAHNPLRDHEIEFLFRRCEYEFGLHDI